MFSKTSLRCLLIVPGASSFLIPITSNRLHHHLKSWVSTTLAWQLIKRLWCNGQVCRKSSEWGYSGRIWGGISAAHKGWKVWGQTGVCELISLEDIYLPANDFLGWHSRSYYLSQAPLGSFHWLLWSVYLSSNIDTYYIYRVWSTAFTSICQITNSTKLTLSMRSTVTIFFTFLKQFTTNPTHQQWKWYHWRNDQPQIRSTCSIGP